MNLFKRKPKCDHDWIRVHTERVEGTKEYYGGRRPDQDFAYIVYHYECSKCKELLREELKIY